MGNPMPAPLPAPDDGTIPVTFFGGPVDGKTMRRKPHGRYRMYFECSDACNLDEPWHDHPMMASYITTAWTERKADEPTAILALIEAVEEY